MNEAAMVRAHLSRLPAIVGKLYEPVRGECEGAAREALLAAVRSFDPARELPLEKWINLKVRGAIKDQIRAWTMVGKQAYRQGERVIFIGVDNLEPHDEPAAEGDVHDEAERAELLGRIESVLRVLPPRELALFRAMYGDGHDIASAGAKLGLHKSWASRLHQRALTRLRKAVLRAVPPQHGSLYG